MKFPNDWATSARGEITEAISPDRKVHFLIVQPEHHKVADVMGEVMTYIRTGNGVSVRAESRKTGSGKLKGRVAQLLSWRGTDAKGELEVRYLIFSTGTNATWLAAAWGPPRALEERQVQLDAILESIDPIAGKKNDRD